jgi:hypothetical protein
MAHGARWSDFPQEAASASDQLFYLQQPNYFIREKTKPGPTGRTQKSRTGTGGVRAALYFHMTE